MKDLFPHSKAVLTAIAIAMAAAVFLVSGQVAKWTTHGSPVWVNQAVLKGSIIVLSLAAMRALRLGRKESGFAMPSAPWRLKAALGLAAGAGATWSLLLTGSPPNPVVAGMSGGALVLWVWLFSSISEEVLCRGLLQSMLAEVDARIAISALFFGAMHLSLFLRGAPASTVLILVFWTSVLGWLAALLRDRTGSLLPPVIAHIAFNFGGAIGGAIYVIAYRVTTGTLPPILR
jgi:membrane protease YdiL (CAAX protease family)